MSPRRVPDTVTFAIAVLAGCGSRTGLLASQNGGPDETSDATADASIDTTADAPIDAMADAPIDVGTDALGDKPIAADDCGAMLTSGPSWMTPFGPAQYVCHSSWTQPRCPSGAFVYGFDGGWEADRFMAGAHWIWRPGIANTDRSDLVAVTFTRTFRLRGAPAGTLAIAADDFAEIDVNGKNVGQVGSISDIQIAGAAQSAPTTFDIGPYLVAGDNTISIVGRNGPSWYANCSGPCLYAQNPVGVVFDGTLQCR